jgi:pimeloyl-ACP methyl ester carboxylesterase
MRLVHPDRRLVGVLLEPPHRRLLPAVAKRLVDRRLQRYDRLRRGLERRSEAVVLRLGVGVVLSPSRSAYSFPIGGDEDDLEAYTAALTRNGFFGPDSWYMNRKTNGTYARTSKNGGKLSMPVLFLHAAYDTTCETMRSTLAEPMRRDCRDLTEVVVKSGHWMAQEQPVAVNAALAKWLAAKFPDYWMV